MFKVLMSTKEFGVFPKQGERFRVGPMTGTCVEHIINDKGYCTHVVMDNVHYCTDFFDMDEREHRFCCFHFGATVECPIVKGKFCNVQFEDGSHCECCLPRMEYEVKF